MCSQPVHPQRVSNRGREGGREGAGGGARYAPVFSPSTGWITHLSWQRAKNWQLVQGWLSIGRLTDWGRIGVPGILGGLNCCRLRSGGVGGGWEGDGGRFFRGASVAPGKNTGGRVISGLDYYPQGPSPISES